VNTDYSAAVQFTAGYYLCYTKFIMINRTDFCITIGGIGKNSDNSAAV
jgi:hypothetical protein